jgi:hypothetical protein
MPPDKYLVGQQYNRAVMNPSPERELQRIYDGMAFPKLKDYEKFKAMKKGKEGNQAPTKSLTQR